MAPDLGALPSALWCWGSSNSTPVVDVPEPYMYIYIYICACKYNKDMQTTPPLPRYLRLSRRSWVPSRRSGGSFNEEVSLQSIKRRGTVVQGSYRVKV